MIVRIVKMSFQPDLVPQFVALFEERKQQIRQVAGCRHLELWQDQSEAHIFFTYSHWEDEAALNQYRSSDFFKDTWRRTKALFQDKAEAWSVGQRVVLA